MIVGIGYGFHFRFLFRFLKSLRKHTSFDLGLGCPHGGAPRSESFDASRTSNRTKRSTSFLKFYLYTFGTGYGREHILSLYFFKLKSTGYILQVPSVT